MAPLCGFVVLPPPELWRRLTWPIFSSWRWAAEPSCSSPPSPQPCGGCDVIALLWGAGAVVVAIYMVAALVRPERF